MKSLKELNTQVIGVQAKTTDYDIALKMQKKRMVDGIKIYAFANFDRAIKDLITGKIGAVMKVFPVANYYTQQYPELYILTEVPNEPQPLGFGINPQNIKLRNALNKAQVAIKADGTYKKIYQKWFSTK